MNVPCTYTVYPFNPGDVYRGKTFHEFLTSNSSLPKRKGVCLQPCALHLDLDNMGARSYVVHQVVEAVAADSCGRCFRVDITACQTPHRFAIGMLLHHHSSWGPPQQG